MMVVDASAALAWLLPSQATPVSEALARSRASLTLVAPFVFAWEVRNVLMGKLRAGALTSVQHDDMVGEFKRLGVVEAEAFAPDLVAETAWRHRLSLFDACYFTMARTLGAALVSRDDELLGACRTSGVPVYDLGARA